MVPSTYFSLTPPRRKIEKRCYVSLKWQFHALLTGTTWLQEIVWLIVNEGNLQKASETQVYFRSPFLEFKDLVLNEVGLDLAESMPSPRVIKTHLPVDLAPSGLFTSKCKVNKWFYCCITPPPLFFFLLCLQSCVFLGKEYYFKMNNGRLHVHVFCPYLDFHSFEHFFNV